MKEFNNYIILAIDNARGGTLSDLIKRKPKEPGLLSDEECSKVMKSLFNGMKHLHSYNYVHRDLKPSNIVIEKPNDYTTVKIVDYGLSVECFDKNGGGLHDTCGTLVY